MKTKLAQFVSYITKFDRRHFQIAYFVLMLAASVILRSPSDGGGGPV